MIVFFKFFNNPNQSRNLLFNKILLNIVKVPCEDLNEDVDVDMDMISCLFSSQLGKCM